MVYSKCSEVYAMKRKLILISLFCSLWLSPASATYLLDRVVAIVNQEVITWSELYRSMETDVMPGVRGLSDEERKKLFKENETIFLENLINFKLQLQEAQSAGIRVSDAEVKEAIDGIKSKYSMSDAKFEETLKSEGYTFDEYRKRLREQITISRIVNQQVRNKVLVNDQDIDAFLRSNKEFEGMSDKYRIRQIFFKKPVDATDRPKTEDRARAVYAMIMEGKDFAALAKEYSEDPSRNSGGDLGFIEKNSLAQEFGSALSQMKPGEVSKPFWTDAGLHIIKYEEKSEKKSPGEIREAARSALSNKLFTERYNAWIKSLRERAFIDIRL
jgi:peptidyl-prolyl cis-trans isomerase SurA